MRLFGKESRLFEPTILLRSSAFKDDVEECDDGRVGRVGFELENLRGFFGSCRSEVCECDLKKENGATL